MNIMFAINNKKERGATLVEFAIGATVFLTAIFAVLEFGRALWVHNALSDAARRGARYAVLNPASDSRRKMSWSTGTPPEELSHSWRT